MCVLDLRNLAHELVRLAEGLEKRGCLVFKDLSRDSLPKRQIVLAYKLGLAELRVRPEEPLFKNDLVSTLVSHGSRFDFE